MYHVPLPPQCIYGRSDEGGENSDGKEVSEISIGGKRERRLPSFLYAHDLVLCGGSEEDPRAMVGGSVEVCRKRGLKVDAGKSMVMVLSGEEGLGMRFA